MHEILLPQSRLQRIRSTYRHPDQAALLARIPLAGRRVPFRAFWRSRSIDPKRIADHSGSYIREHLPLARQRFQAVGQAATMVRPGDALLAYGRGARRGIARGATGARAVARRAPRGRMTAIFGAFALGALLAYFFDAHSGRRRRALVRDKFAHARRVFRRDLLRMAQKRARFFGGVARGVGHNAADFVPHHLRHEFVDDETLVARVRSEALRADGIKAGEIHVDAHEGVVTLRGQLEHPEDIRRIVMAAERIEGVSQVRNYLHLPGTLPPNKADAFTNGYAVQWRTT